MQLPNREFAYVPSSKLVDYLLSRTHAVGKSKARFFRRFGFDEKNVDQFKQSLKKIAQENEISEHTLTVHGQKYIIDGELQTPMGKTISVRTVWIIEKGASHPRFVTAHPV